MENKTGLAHALDQLEREKGIKKDDILRMIEQAMVSAYKKHAGENLNVIAHIESSGEISAFVVKKIVLEVNDNETEVSLELAQSIDPSAEEGGEVQYPIDTAIIGRIAAQTAKQVLTQKIRETEREYVFDEFKPKEGTIVNGTVHRFSNRNVIVELGRAEGILPVREQVRREHWTAGERIRALVLRVEKGPRGPEVVLSRAHEDFVKKLFELEVPEIYEKTIRVVNVVREPGARSKVVVQSFNSKIDPIGACVGVKGSRVRPIINELQGERIDLIQYSEDPAAYIGASLTPAKPTAVNIISAQEKRAEAMVPDDMLALAIGKNGQNIRLACKLTGWQIDVKTENQRKLEAKASVTSVKEMLTQLEGIGPRIADVLVKGGMDSIQKIASSKVDDLTVFSGIGEKLAEKIVESAKAALTGVVSNGPKEPDHSNDDEQIIVEGSVNGHAEAETPGQEQ